MILLVALLVLALACVSHAGVSMNNPFFCYMTDPIRANTMMHSTSTSYEAIRRFNFPTVDHTVSRKIFSTICEHLNNNHI